jgi:hypothetical protein
MAHLEAASVDAFKTLRNELRAHGAPSALVSGAGKAARDEARHARVTRALARRHGGRFQKPVVVRAPLRDLETIATENVVEGCVRETMGALVATHQALAARDPVVRAAMIRIARDETRHAALAHSVHDWAMRRLDRAARARVESARRAAVSALVTTRSKLDPEAQAALGLPSPEEVVAMSRALFAHG